MAMQFEEDSVTTGALILKRAPFEGVAITLDFTGNTTGVIKAGTPINTSGEADPTATGTIKGILLHDVLVSRPQGTVLTKAYINTAVALANAGLESYSADVKSALPMVVFE